MPARTQSTLDREGDRMKLLIDEADAFRKENTELKKLLAELNYRIRAIEEILSRAIDLA